MTSMVAARACVSTLFEGGVTRRGPFVEFASQAGLDRYASALDETLDAITPTGPRTWSAPSPWHAAAWLRDVAAGAAEGKPIWPQPTGSQSMALNGALLLRGQCDASWAVSPTLYRQAEAEALAGGAFDKERFGGAMSARFEALARFRDAVHGLTDSANLGLAPAAHLATAQHYGLPTFLLDITVDPLIAVWFASDGARRGQEAAVYWLTFDDAVEAGLNVVLAPPWVRRIHRQLGIFLDCFGAIEALARGLPWYRVVFPADPDYTRLYADEANALYTEDAWFASAVEWARTSTLQVDAGDPAAAAALVAELRGRVGEPPFLHDMMFGARMAEWPDLLARLLDWLVLKRIDGQPTVDCAPLRLVARDNPAFFHFLRIAISVMRTEDIPFADGLGQYADAIDACLGD